MLDTLFSGVFDTTVSFTSITNFIICMVVALVLGLLLALTYTYKNRYTKSFFLALAVLPAVVCVVIMMVNGNIGTGVAVAGAFSLVRFRSAPGTAKEISFIFIAMGTGLITGMGYLTYAFLFTMVLCGILLLYTRLGFADSKGANADKILRITIPEDLDYTGVFDDLMEEYTRYREITDVKTSNMGSLFRLTYFIKLKDITKEKEFIDKLRCRNGNLEISISNQEANRRDL
ncbi:MAG: DUF4956 domain-containing protein [Clostridiales bacterium]|jgi:hypothetical protein|nr:DUF4956 domain-containing protein [Clostridiales bacterium]